MIRNFLFLFSVQVNDDWSASAAPPVVAASVPAPSDWAAESTGQQMGAAPAQWGGSSNWN
jgi:hypothetical protein